MSLTRKKTFRVPARLGVIIFLFDLIAFLFCFLLSNFIFPFVINQESVIPTNLEYRYYAFSYIICTLVFMMRGHYRDRIPYWQQVKTVVKVVFSVVLITMTCVYIFRLHIFLLNVTIHWVLVLILICLARSTSFRILNYFKGWQLDVTLLGDNQMIIDCMYAFYGDGQTGFLVSTIMLRDINKTPICFDYIPEGHPPINHVDATNGNYLQNIIDKPQSFYIVDLEGMRGENRDALIRTLEHNDIDYAIMPPTKRLNLYGMKPLYFFGNDVMILHGRYHYDGKIQLVIKRLFDIIVSGFLIPFLGLATLVIYMLKKINNVKSPLFYDGLRVGRDGKEFKCWKYSTMKPDADKLLNELLVTSPDLKKEWDSYQKIENDPRIDSGVSQLLRKASLDEIPQIWNVFVGDMSLVGPRPILPQQKQEYGGAIDVYTSFRPGMTGLWQVSGRNETTFEQRVYWDNWYVKNWSLWHDFVVLFKTVSVVLTKRGSV